MIQTDRYWGGMEQSRGGHNGDGGKILGKKFLKIFYSNTFGLLFFFTLEFVRVIFLLKKPFGKKS